MFPNFFADADALFGEAKFVIFGIPYEDKEMSFRKGASLAPSSIREASWNFESYNILSKTDLQDIKIHDHGDISIDEIPSFIKKIENAIPIVIGGSHAITPPIISAISKTKEFGVVILDAHLDFRDEYNGSKESHACTTRRIVDMIGTKKITSLGIRSMSREEEREAEEKGLIYFTSWEVMAALGDILDSIPFEKIYLSIDMDVLDPSYAPGVGNPEPLGISDFELIEIIRKLAPRIIALDVVEVSPPYDDGRTAVLAAKIIRDYISWNSSYHL